MYARVTATQQLTPGLVRVVLGGGDLDRFDDARRHGCLRERGDPSPGRAVRTGLRPEGSARPAPQDHLAGAASLHGAGLGPVDAAS